MKKAALWRLGFGSTGVRLSPAAGCAWGGVLFLVGWSCSWDVVGGCLVPSKIFADGFDAQLVCAAFLAAFDFPFARFKLAVEDDVVTLLQSVRDVVSEQ